MLIFNKNTAVLFLASWLHMGTPVLQENRYWCKNSEYSYFKERRGRRHSARIMHLILHCNSQFYLVSCPETPDKKLLVSDLESGDFFSWQGNRGVARRRTLVRRTSKAED